MRLIVHRSSFIVFPSSSVSLFQECGQSKLRLACRKQSREFGALERVAASPADERRGGIERDRAAAADPLYIKGIAECMPPRV